MFVNDRVPDFPPGRMRARSNARQQDLAIAAVYDRRTCRSHNLSLHFGNDLFRLDITARDHEPARTLSNSVTKENHDQTKRPAASEYASPTEAQCEIQLTLRQ